MSRLVIQLIALIAVTGLSNHVESSQIEAIDLNRVLEFIKQQRLNTVSSKQPKLRVRIVSSDSDTYSDSDSDDTSTDDSDDSEDTLAKRGKERIVDFIETGAKQKTNNKRLYYRKGKKDYGQSSDKSDDLNNKRLVKERIIDLIEKLVKANNEKDRLINFRGKQNYIPTSYVIRSENNENDNNNVQNQILEKLFSHPSNNVEQQLKPKTKKLIPNRLTPTVNIEDVKKYYENKNKNIEVPGLEDYSKVYIVLNPQAVKKSKNKYSLNDLISKVLSLSAPTSNREPQDKRFRYKGFVVNDNYPKRRFKEINNINGHMRYDEKKVDPLRAPLGRITAMP